MNYIGITLFLITTISIMVVLILHKWTKKIFSSYWFYLLFSISYLIYFIVFRYTQNIIDFIRIDDLEYLKQNDPYKYSYSFSKILFLDLCPFISIFLPISLILDKTRTTSKVLSLYGIIGGIATIYGNMIFVQNINTNIFLFLIVGDSPNYIMFSSHYLILLISIITLLNSKKFTKWSLLGTLLFIILFISYVLTLSFSLGIECNTTGLTKGDWYNPYPTKYWYSQYGNLYNLVKFNYILCVIFWYSIAGVIIVLIIFIKNVFTRDKKLSTYKLWWSKLKRIDDNINNLLARVEQINHKNNVMDFKYKRSST